jgi:O-antigen/teichoic acid export membrane protein
VLVALDRQRWITVSFLIAATFNVVANLLVIPRYSYAGSAAVTILSELVLMVPFLWGLRDIGAPPILVLAWRPALATSLMAVVMAALATAGAPFGAVLLAGVTCFVVALLALGGITQEDRALLARLVRPPAPALPDDMIAPASWAAAPRRSRACRP